MRIATLLLIICLLSLPTELLAQRKKNAKDISNVQGGEVSFEEEVHIDTYSETQASTIEFFRNMQARVLELSKGSSVSPATIPDSFMKYLSGVYLFCSISSGTCPLVLEAILENDIINSRLAGKASCPLMKQFWHFWVSNGMEDRLKYSVKTPYMNQVAEFNRNIRPEFLLCESTVQNAIFVATKNNASFFKDRYGDASRPSQLATKMVALLEAIKEKIPNVFIATGVQKAPTPKAK